MDTKQISHALLCAFPSPALKPLTFYYDFLPTVSVEKQSKASRPGSFHKHSLYLTMFVDDSMFALEWQPTKRDRKIRKHNKIYNHAFIPDGDNKNQ